MCLGVSVGLVLCLESAGSECGSGDGDWCGHKNPRSWERGLERGRKRSPERGPERGRGLEASSRPGTGGQLKAGGRRQAQGRGPGASSRPGTRCSIGAMLEPRGQPEAWRQGGSTQRRQASGVKRSKSGVKPQASSVRSPARASWAWGPRWGVLGGGNSPECRRAFTRRTCNSRLRSLHR